MFKIQPEVLQSIIDKYGLGEQLCQVMGECGELVAVIQNYRRTMRYGNRNEDLTDVMEEAADVFLMIQQIRHMDPERFDMICERKYQKCLSKMENGK
jgi:NTP pyrophosphatase (non-canonical NTP hydrolase)